MSTSAENNREARFYHLLQPIRDLAESWNIDVARELEDYLDELEGITISFDGGKTSLNFVEAALLIQGSTAVYSRKVEYLYSLIYDTLDLITSNTRNKGKGKRDNDKENQMLLAAAAEAEEEFLLLDEDMLRVGKNIDMVEKHEAIAYSTALTIAYANDTVQPDTRLLNSTMIGRVIDQKYLVSRALHSRAYKNDPTNPQELEKLASAFISKTPLATFARNNHFERPTGSVVSSGDAHAFQQDGSKTFRIASSIIDPDGTLRMNGSFESLSFSSLYENFDSIPGTLGKLKTIPSKLSDNATNKRVTPFDITLSHFAQFKVDIPLGDPQDSTTFRKMLLPQSTPNFELPTSDEMQNPAEYASPQTGNDTAPLPLVSPTRQNYSLMDNRPNFDEPSEPMAFDNAYDDEDGSGDMTYAPYASPSSLHQPQRQSMQPVLHKSTILEKVNEFSVDSLPDLWKPVNPYESNDKKVRKEFKSSRTYLILKNPKLLIHEGIEAALANEARNRALLNNALKKQSKESSSPTVSIRQGLRKELPITSLDTFAKLDQLIPNFDFDRSGGFRQLSLMPSGQHVHLPGLHTILQKNSSLERKRERALKFTQHVRNTHMDKQLSSLTSSNPLFSLTLEGQELISNHEHQDYVTVHAGNQHIQKQEQLVTQYGFDNDHVDDDANFGYAYSNDSLNDDYIDLPGSEDPALSATHAGDPSDNGKAPPLNPEATAENGRNTIQDNSLALLDVNIHDDQDLEQLRNERKTLLGIHDINGPGENVHNQDSLYRNFDQLSLYEDSEYWTLVQQQVAQFSLGADLYLRTSRLSRRVDQWRSKIEPILQAEEQRTEFSLRKYRNLVAKQIATGSITKDVEITRQTPAASFDMPMGDSITVEDPSKQSSFSDLVAGLAAYPQDVSRYFVAALQMAADGEILISTSSSEFMDESQPADTEVDEFPFSQAVVFTQDEARLDERIEAKSRQAMSRILKMEAAKQKDDTSVVYDTFAIKACKEKLRIYMDDAAEANTTPFGEEFDLDQLDSSNKPEFSSKGSTNDTATMTRKATRASASSKNRVSRPARKTVVESDVSDGEHSSDYSSSSSDVPSAPLAKRAKRTRKHDDVEESNPVLLTSDEDEDLVVRG